MALGIGLDDQEFFAPSHPGHNNQLRLLHYPPVPAANIEDQPSTRMAAHSDWPSITMLFQDDCGGLQVYDQ
jgi:isopenicillin N synthase-like dioxygenase